MKRTASIIAKTDCDLLAIEKKDFKVILEEYKRAVFKKERILDEVFPIIKKTINSSRIIQSIIFSFKTRNLTKGQILIKERDFTISANKVYVVEEGEFIVEKLCGEKELKNLTGENFYKIKEKAVGFKEKLKVCILGPKAIIGEETLFSLNGEYFYTVTCISQAAVVLEITKSDVKAHCPHFFYEHLFKVFVGKQENRGFLMQEQLNSIYMNFKESQESFKREEIIKNQAKEGNILKKKVNKASIDPNSIIRKNTSKDDKFKEEIRKITKHFVISQQNAYLKNHENISKNPSFSSFISQKTIEKPIKTPDKSTKPTDFFENDIFSHDITKNQQKYIKVKMASFNKNKEKSAELSQNLHRDRSWYVKRFLDKTKENVNSLRKDSLEKTNGWFLGVEEVEAPYGLLNIKGLGRK